MQHFVFMFKGKHEALLEPTQEYPGSFAYVTPSAWKTQLLEVLLACITIKQGEILPSRLLHHLTQFSPLSALLNLPN